MDKIKELIERRIEDVERKIKETEANYNFLIGVLESNREILKDIEEELNRPTKGEQKEK